MITIILFFAALNCMLFYCITIGNYIGKTLGRFIGYLVIGYGIGIKVALDDGEVVTVKGPLCRQILKAIDKADKA